MIILLSGILAIGILLAYFFFTWHTANRQTPTRKISTSTTSQLQFVSKLKSKPEIGFLAPDFILTDLNGKNYP